LKRGDDAFADLLLKRQPSRVGFDEASDRAHPDQVLVGSECDARGAGGRHEMMRAGRRDRQITDDDEFRMPREDAGR